LYGGRTEAFKTYFKCNKKQRIYYLDFVSLYPTVMALDQYATGFRRYRPNTTVEDILEDRFIGLVKCQVIPPKDLYLPVLPSRKNKKLLFELNEFEGVYTTIELRLALQKGYKINILSATEYDRTDKLMCDYVSFFLKLKTQYSGKKSDDEVEELNRYHEKIGLNMDYIRLTSEECEENKGLKQMAKLCLNSLWGKFGQAIERESSDFINDKAKLMRYLLDEKNKKIDVIDIYNHKNIDNNMVEIRYIEDHEKIMEADYISEITACFTTSNARVRLYNFMDKLHPSQLFYCDTDSCIFLVDEEDKNHINPFERDDISIGKGLGQLEDELKGDYITELVIGGAKSYAYRTKAGKIEMKQKGINLNMTTSRTCNFDNFRTLVLDDEVKPLKTGEIPQIVFDRKKFQMITKFVSKDLKPTITNKRRRVENTNDTLPIGFEE
jgi:hypothetical protein